MIRRWRLFTRSTIARFVLLAFLFQLPVTAGLLIFVQQASQQALLGEQKGLVAELQNEMLSAFHDGGQENLKRLVRSRLDRDRGGTAVILFADRDGTPIAGNLGAWPPTVPSHTDWRTIDLYRMGGDQPEHMGIATITLPTGARLLTGHVLDASLKLARVNEEAIVTALILGIVLTFACALILGHFLSRQIKGIVDTSVAIGDGRLAWRVPANGSGDAFDALGTAINLMLERIEALVSQLRMMTDGLAHDLKSPVTRLKSTLERAIVETRDPAALAALQRVDGEAETLLSMLSTALLISRADAGIGRDNFAELNLNDLLVDLAEVYGPLAEDRGFTIETSCPSGLTFSVHRELMSQAIGNLIENALKYAIGGHRITLFAQRTDTGVDIVVSDDGPGIAPARRAEALRRFGRLDPARQLPGSGLGLALVGAVVRLHGGALSLEGDGSGLVVRLCLPD